MKLEEIVERFKEDQYATKITGIEIINARKDYAKVTLAVVPKHMNAVGIMQGGALFTLADFAFAVAANAESEESVVAVECSISFFKPVTDGVLFAEAVLVSKSKSLTSYEITITNGNGDLIAKFHGRGFIRKKR